MKKLTKTKTSKVPAKTPRKAAGKSATATLEPRVALATKAKGIPTEKRAASAADTRIEAQIDVGFGNTLYIRGEGPGLSWERGIAMACTSDDRWAVSIPDASRPVVCKFLINDIVWNDGDDFVVMPGTSISFAPAF